MISKTLQKRDSLERFIREQTLGPGINGFKFVDLENSELLERSLDSKLSIDYHNEIIDILPAAVYSTGILFPEDRSESGTIGVLLDNNEQIEVEEEEELDFQNNSLESEDTSNGIELNQMYPKAMGLTYCITEEGLIDEGIDFNVFFRYYRKLKQDKEGKFNKRYGLRVEVDVDLIKDFIEKENLTDFKLITKGENHFLILNKISGDRITDLKSKIRSIKKQHSETLFDKIVGSYPLPKLTREKSNLSNLKSTIFYELKRVAASKDKREKLYFFSQEIELIENITDHLRNLLEVYSGGYGLWESLSLKRHVRIQNINFPKTENKLSFIFNQIPSVERIIVTDENGKEQVGLKNIFSYEIGNDVNDIAALSANVQISRDSRKKGDKIFIKVQLLNTSSPFVLKESDSRYFSTFNEIVNQRSFFGVKISAQSDYIVPYSEYNYSKDESDKYDEDTTTKFIYDQYKDYSIGHGCSSKWDAKANLVETEYLPSCETPDIDPIPRDKSKPAILNSNGEFNSPLFLDNSQSQEFKWLSIFSDAKDDEIIDGLLSFVNSYGTWIKNKRDDEKYSNSLKEIAYQELDKCEEDYNRMIGNIKNFLSGEKNRENLKSFRLMNSSMFMQLWHSVNVGRGRINDVFENESFDQFNFDFYKHSSDKLFSETESAGWRAFQLAFIILNLDGIFRSDQAWSKRNEWVDLVWFPTGGGKTEAYLGLIALTIINRRKSFNVEGGGVASIMRYTLRLLTMQQFQRATLVIMALELLRRWGTSDLGKEPITIGLWVGNDSLPNKSEDLIVEFEKLNNNQTNKIPFSKCPWCGSEIKGETKKDTQTLESRENHWYREKVHLHCTNEKCCFWYKRPSRRKTFQDPLPLCLSDETIYLHPPTLLFGTVDKFAQLAHKVNGSEQGRISDSRRLFGNGNWEKGKPENGYIPPDLIIQDELHLLLGPLGSAVALFESAIDQLCTREDGTRPKIISSTATTRNTQIQIAALFDRKVNLFPKPGVECDDSFFAFYRRKYDSNDKENEQYLSKRKYLGVLPTGRTQIWMQMRLAAIIMTHRAVFELHELEDKSPIDFEAFDEFLQVMDYYHTTISYFNSLKEVGKTQSQIQSYILKELRRVFNRVIRPNKLMHPLYTYGPLNEAELTGRLSGEEVKTELHRIETKWRPNNRFARTVDEKIISGQTPPEFVVATNMISVGIDVSRFNTIIMNSMPRNTAEYIQASSRVARNDYGLVFTVHHPFRARDMSHYEKFIEFHEKMYSFVEPISITPFTKKSVNKYMGLYVATMIRHKSRFTERKSAKEIESIPEAELEVLILELTTYFERRRERMSNQEIAISNLIKRENVEEIKTWIEEAFKEWVEFEESLDQSTDLVFNRKINRYSKERKEEQLYVEIDEYDDNIHSKKWKVPMSLREIESQAAIKILPN